MTNGPSVVGGSVAVTSITVCSIGFVLTGLQVLPGLLNPLAQQPTVIFLPLKLAWVAD